MTKSSQCIAMQLLYYSQIFAPPIVRENLVADGPTVHFSLTNKMFFSPGALPSLQGSLRSNTFHVAWADGGVNLWRWIWTPEVSIDSFQLKI